MAELTQNPISFPWQMFMDAQQMKNQNQQNMYGNITGIGQGLGNIGKTLMMQKVLSSLINGQNGQNVPQGTPATAGVNGAMAPNPPSQGSSPDLTQAIMQIAPFDPTMAGNLAGLGGQLANTKKTNMEMTGMLPYQQASLAEQSQAHRDTEANRQMALQLQALIAHGQLSQAKEGLEARKANDLMQAQIRAQSENAKSPIRNAWRGFKGQPPLVSVPGIDIPFTFSDQKRLDELERKARQ